MTEQIAWVQLTIPSPSAALLAHACQVAMNEWDGGDHGYAMLNDLRDFLTTAADNPRAFPPSGTMASSLKARGRRGRGVRRNDGTLKDGTPRPSGRHRRKTRHQRRLRAAKERRANRAEDAAAFNAARDAIESEMASIGPEPQPERGGGDTRGSAGRAEGQDQASGMQG